ncbi:MAG: S1-like domain-containing RNA-binding protein [Desulforhopalus sp.]
MVQIGKMNRLSVKGTQAYGIHLDGGEYGDILLRGRHPTQNNQAAYPDNKIDVFIYVDSEQRLLATVQKPYATVGEFAFLKVKTNTAAGAFLDWGLENDLFVPKSEQQDNMREGKSYVVFIFLNEHNNRITASSKLDKYLDLRPPDYEEGEKVKLIIYARTDLGYNAVVNGSHTGMIYENEVFQKLVIGQRLQGYIKKIREDLKIDLRLQRSGYQGVEEASDAILNIIKNCGGMVSVTEKSPPDEVYELFGVSKKVFKKAIGALYKKRFITINADGIKLVD